VHFLYEVTVHHLPNFIAVANHRKTTFFNGLKPNILRFLALFLLFLLLAFSVSATPVVPIAKREARTIDIAITQRSEAEGALEAKQKALAEAERKAVFAALDKVDTKHAREMYRTIRAEDMSQFVISLTTTREVQKAGSYEADILYRIDEEKILALMGHTESLNATAAGDPTGNGLLILPSYDAGGSLLLFEKENIWRAIINNVALEVGQGLLVLPFGDKDDKALLNDATILAGDRAALTALARRYGTRNVVIAAARSRNVEGMPVVEITLRKPAGRAPEEPIVLMYKADSALETLDIVLARAAKDVTLKLRESLEDYSLFASPKDKAHKSVVIRAQYRSGDEWRRMLRAFESVPTLEALQVGSVGVNTAQLTLFFKGESNLIQRTLQARNMTVEEAGAFWVVRSSELR
jgi:Uncharacterized protein conserved in bacteria (DUF2066)